MRLQDFELRLLDSHGDYFVEEENGHVVMQHGKTYRVLLHNHSHRACDVRLELDGENVGEFRVNARAAVCLERGSEDDGYFTFYLAGTEEANRVGLGRASRNDLGLVRATFMPEKLVEREVKTSGGIRGSSIGFDSLSSSSRLIRTQGANFSAGGTGLSGHSSQQFITVENLDYAPKSEWGIITLRIVGKADPRPKVAVASSGPAFNPTPPPV